MLSIGSAKGLRDEHKCTAAGIDEINSDQTKTKTETKIQKRTRILDSYRFDEKICKKDDQQLKLAP
jgi:hypothetical protein